MGPNRKPKTISWTDSPKQSLNALGARQTSCFTAANTHNSVHTPQPRLADVARQTRIVKVLCFCYNEKFAPGHHCKTSALTFMEVSEDDPLKEASTDNSDDKILFMLYLVKPVMLL